AILICTVLSQFLKRFVYPDELNLRPISLEDQHIIIHKITGVEISTYNSFPSGHTSTAFTLALLLAYFTSKKLWAFILPLIALSVGYSRIYLAQHFVTDICGGIVVGLVSSFLSLLIYNSWLKKRQRRLENN
ncbi:MAG: PA-phosphatase, partial [Chitinophagaceae bacterium]